MTKTTRERRAERALVLAVALAGLGGTGCFTLRAEEGKAASPVPLSVALADMENNLSRLHVLVLSDAQFLGSDRPEDKAAIQRIRDVIAGAQCYALAPARDAQGKLKRTPSGKLMRNVDYTLRTKNPLVPVVNGALQLQVQGQISESGTFNISAAGGVGGTLTRQAEQQVTMPLSLVSLTNLVNFYVGQQLATLQYLSLVGGSTPAPTSDAGILVGNVMTIAKNLGTIVKDALDGFTKDQNAYCQGRDRPRVPHVGDAGVLEEAE